MLILETFAEINQLSSFFFKIKKNVGFSLNLQSLVKEEFSSKGGV